jgi:hypothetical protein
MNVARRLDNINLSLIDTMAHIVTPTRGISHTFSSWTAARAVVGGI